MFQRGSKVTRRAQVLLCCFKSDSIVLASNPRAAVCRCHVGLRFYRIQSNSCALFWLCGSTLEGGIQGVYNGYLYSTYKLLVFLRRKCLSYNDNHFSKHINSAQRKWLGHCYSYWQRPTVFVSGHSQIVIGHVSRKHAIVAKSSSLTY